MTITITVPGAVWYDYLDPAATGMQAELGLPLPRHRRVGKGSQAVYEGVSPEVARELADHLEDRAGGMLNSDDEDRHAHHSAIKAAKRIRREVRA